MFSHWTSTDADNCSDAKKWKFWLLMKLTSLPHIYIIQSTRFACWSDKRTKQEDFSPFYWVFPCLSNIYNAYCATKFSQTVNHWSLTWHIAAEFANSIDMKLWEILSHWIRHPAHCMDFVCWTIYSANIVTHNLHIWKVTYIRVIWLLAIWPDIHVYTASMTWLHSLVVGHGYIRLF